MRDLVYYRDLDEQLLVFPVLGNDVALELKHVMKISLVNEVIPVPRSPDYIIGIVNIDGNLYPIIDLNIMMRGEVEEQSRNVIVILVEIDEIIFGIHTSILPQVTQGTVDVDEGETSLPNDWIIGFSEGENEKIPIIDPHSFWIGLGDNEISGPSVDLKLEFDVGIEEAESDSEEDKSNGDLESETDDDTSNTEEEE